ncbi:FG-GAP repeat domain-containing protein [Haloechinothrix halophila]|uniref:FG-GAP repeat domain-containing protein n=1 Tax=Haloechinothrix halophila TaxID=1069073 RepID=UPI000424287E|nr:VCBS repeat-containing protein [Haloechinothrix halophila]
MLSLLRRAVVPALALALCVAVGVFTVRPSLGHAEAEELTSGFAFDTVKLNSAPPDARQQREVQPNLERIRAWISAVGAAVSVTDLRGLGRAADACLVDPRDDSVTVLPVPGAGGSDYERFTLTPDGLPYDATMAPMGCVPADLDENGAMDFVVYYWGRSPVVFLNSDRGEPQAGLFTAHELISPMEVWNTSALSMADVDGDGHLDIIAGNYFPDGARVLDPEARGDARMRMQHSMGDAQNAGINRLLLTDPTGTAGELPRITDASTAMPKSSAHAWTLAFGWQDLTGNQLPDLYVANDFGPDDLLVNASEQGHVRFTEVVAGRDLTTPGSQVLGHGSFKGMGVAYTWDPGDALPMITVSNITTPFALHESNYAFVSDGRQSPGDALLAGESPYKQAAEQLGMARSGWSWDIKSGDFDNSGTDELLQTTGFLKGERNRWPELQELAMGNDDLLNRPELWPKFQLGDDLSGHESNPLWTRAEDGRYYDLASELGIDEPHLSRGLALSDVDGDGTLDALVANQWEDSVLLRNRSSNAGDAAYLRLLRPGAAGGWVDVIGAQVDHEIDGETKRAQLYPSNGHAGASGPEVQLALPDGESTEATITWRDSNSTHRSTVEVQPGHHTVELGTDGTAVLR